MCGAPISRMLTDHAEMPWYGIAETLARSLRDRAVQAAVRMIKQPEGAGGRP